MPRKSFICDATGDLCSNPKCKIGFCIIESQEKEKEKERARLEALEREAVVRKEAERVAAAVLKLKGIKKPTAELVQRIARLPTIVDGARSIVEEIAKNRLGRP
jgi:hypothetical protein